jgi:hypothetical protein
MLRVWLGSDNIAGATSSMRCDHVPDRHLCVVHHLAIPGSAPSASRSPLRFARPHECGTMGLCVAVRRGTLVGAARAEPRRRAAVPADRACAQPTPDAWRVPLAADGAAAVPPAAVRGVLRLPRGDPRHAAPPPAMLRATAGALWPRRAALPCAGLRRGWSVLTLTPRRAPTGLPSNAPLPNLCRLSAALDFALPATGVNVLRVPASCFPNPCSSFPRLPQLGP